MFCLYFFIEFVTQRDVLYEFTYFVAVKNKEKYCYFCLLCFFWRKCYVSFVVYLIIGPYLFAKYYYCCKVK
jgi:hypothetical protein